MCIRDRWNTIQRTVFESVENKAAATLAPPRAEVVRPGLTMLVRHMAVKTRVIDVQTFVGPAKWEQVRADCAAKYNVSITTFL